jgi:hypothetical protein
MSDEDRRDLEEFANAGAQRNQPTRQPSGHALVRPTQGITERVIGAQPVAIKRDEPGIMRKLAQNAAMAGSDWFYRFPVRSKEGQQWIEGPSIKLANEVARIWGNCATEVREVDVGDAWVFYARFTDFETGFQMERAYRQYKTQMSIKTGDIGRAQAGAYQTGQSKAIRNVICNSLQMYSDFAFEQAQNSLVDKIGRDVENYRERAVAELGRMSIDVHRVERVIGRATKQWLAPDLARLASMLQAIKDGMATAEEQFPEAADKQVAAAKPPQETKPESQPATAESETKPEQATPAPKAAPKNFAEYMDLVYATAKAATDIDQLRAWFVSDGQRKARNAAGMLAEETTMARKVIEERAKELHR